jgi:hypothetical protein
MSEKELYLKCTYSNVCNLEVDKVYKVMYIKTKAGFYRIRDKKKLLVYVLLGSIWYTFEEIMLTPSEAEEINKAVNYERN